MQPCSLQGCICVCTLHNDKNTILSKDSFVRTTLQRESFVDGGSPLFVVSSALSFSSLPPTSTPIFSSQIMDTKRPSAPIMDHYSEPSTSTHQYSPTGQSALSKRRNQRRLAEVAENGVPELHHESLPSLHLRRELSTVSSKDHKLTDNSSVSSFDAEGTSSTVGDDMQCTSSTTSSVPSSPSFQRRGRFTVWPVSKDPPPEIRLKKRWFK
mmetsp:Transcript_25695/g.60452  ORF Transcript_25695/g.60452 Transcript_25695/m.60452 type:complete len:211 (+) Transcript_25695:86-718(+)